MSRCPSGLRERSAKPCFVGSNPTLDSTLILLLMDREENFLKESGFRELKRFITLAVNFMYLLLGLKPM